MKLFALLVLLYLTLDLSHPGLAGALCFDADASVEVVSLKRVPTPGAPAGKTLEPPVVAVVVYQAPRRVRPHPRPITRAVFATAHAAARSAPSDSPSEEG